MKRGKTLSKDEMAYQILWELCSGYWQATLKHNDDGKQMIAERIMDVMELDNEETEDLSRKQAVENLKEASRIINK